jgi:hypothetical protein
VIDLRGRKKGAGIEELASAERHRSIVGPFARLQSERAAASAPRFLPALADEFGSLLLLLLVDKGHKRMISRAMPPIKRGETRIKSYSLFRPPALANHF